MDSSRLPPRKLSVVAIFSCKRFGAMMSAVRTGCPLALESAVREHSLTAEDARAADNFALKTAASLVSSDMLRSLRTTFSLTAEDARAGGNLALKRAAANGRSVCLYELCVGYGLGAADARECGPTLFKLALLSRDFSSVLRCLRDDFGLTAMDATQNNSSVLRIATAQGNTLAISALREIFGLCDAALTTE